MVDERKELGDFINNHMAFEMKEDNLRYFCEKHNCSQSGDKFAMIERLTEVLGLLESKQQENKVGNQLFDENGYLKVISISGRVRLRCLVPLHQPLKKPDECKLIFPFLCCDSSSRFHGNVFSVHADVANVSDTLFWKDQSGWDDYKDKLENLMSDYMHQRTI